MDLILSPSALTSITTPTVSTAGALYFARLDGSAGVLLAQGAVGFAA
jgi:hypothetical protein